MIKWVFFYTRYIVLFFIFFGVRMLYGQVSEQGTPESFFDETKSSVVIPESILDSVYVTQYLEEDSKKGIPNRYGIVRSLSVDIMEEGVESQSGNYTVWRYRIKCPDAVSMGINFESFDVPEGASVYVYTSDKQKIKGAFTTSNNKENSFLSISEIQGNDIVVEYDLPTGLEYKGDLQIGSVTLAYKSLSESARSWIEINCPEASDWQKQKHAVCLMSFQDDWYIYSCTGALVNNVNEDETPYFLTANHCISTSSMAKTLITYFNYENSECGGDDASLDQSLSGASLVAENDASDFTLLLLSEYPPTEYEPYYAGWNASDDAPETGTSIHHPEGEYKCIAFDYDAPESYAYRVMWDDNNITDANTHWEVFYDEGTDESGSSGGPLFDQNKRIIGQLHGGDDTSSLFGKFSVSWDHSSTSSKQLKSWLDPDNTGTERLDGLNYASVPTASFKSEVTLSCLNTSISLSDESAHHPTSWLWKVKPETVTFVDGTDSTSQNPEIEFLNEGYYSVELIASNQYGTDTTISAEYIHAVSELDVEFEDFEDELTICGCDLDDYLLVAGGANEYSYEIGKSEYFELYSSDDSLKITLKDAARKYGSFDTYVKVVGSHGSCEDTDSILLHVEMPVNDDVANAFELNLGNNGYYQNKCGTVEDDEPTGMSTNNTVWFSFIGPTSGEMDIRIDGAATMQALYQADSYSELLNGNYDLISTNKSYSTENENTGLQLQPGDTYWLQVGSVNDSYGDLSIELLSNTLEVYPNPSTGKFYFTVSSMESGTAEIGVYTMSGQLLVARTMDFTLDSNTTELDLSGQAKGAYFFRANINGVTTTKKIVLTE